MMVPSKVPLGEFFNGCIPAGKRYSFKQVIQKLRVSGKKGLVINLTNTTRYYQTLDLKREGIKHIKIQWKGRDAVPDNASVNNFVHEVIQFLSQNHKQPRKYILVHCTHGQNRSRYMIVHYLMRSQPISASQAIERFSEARPPGIYKPDYIDALFAFYHEKKPDIVVCPPTPEWKRSSELDINGEAIPYDGNDGGPAAPSNSEEDFYVRYYTLQILTALLTNSPNRLQEAILTIPRGVTQLMDMLMDREAIRNEALLLLTYLTREAEEIQKIVVFEGAFKKIFSIIKVEGGAEGGVVVQTNNLLGDLEAINLLMMGGTEVEPGKDANKPTNKTVLVQKKVLDYLLLLGVESQWAPVAVRCAALRCIGDLDAGHPKNLDALASKVLGKEPQVELALDSIL